MRIDEVNSVSKSLTGPRIDSVEVAAEKLYEIIEGHLNEMPPAERKKHLDAIGKAHSRLISQDSKKRSLRRRTSHPQAVSLSR